MKAKTIVTAALLLFVAASVIYLVVQETGAGARRDYARLEKHPAAKESQNTQAAASSENPKFIKKVVVYYFHGTTRCPTCRKIEVYAYKALESGFGNALRSGKLQWRLINLDKPENNHYVQEYALVSKSLVVADLQNGRQKRWKNLQRIWELVGDQQAFLRYVQEEVKKYLEDCR